MDEQVLRAMARWPDVPAVYGWLRLDRRGGWHLIDRGRPGFDEARDGQGSPITSPPIIDFIHRNYGHDEHGRWYWQNGPQRVYVDLDSAPLVLRVFGEGAGARFVAHTGQPVTRIERGFIGPGGEILLGTDIGPGVVHDLDLAALALDEAGDGAVSLRLCESAVFLGPGAAPAETLGYTARPRPD